MEDMVMIVESGSAPDDEGKNVTAARKNLVSDLLCRVRTGKAAHKKAFERIEEDMDLAFHGYDPKTWDDSKYVVNLAQRHVQQRTAALYAKNPRAIAKPRRRMMATFWDDDPKTLAQALESWQRAEESGMPIPPRSQQIVREYDQIKSEMNRLKRIAKTLEMLFSYFMQEAQPGFKSQMKALVRRMLVTGVGYVKLGFQREMERKPEISARMNDIQVQLDHLERLAGDAIEGKINDSSAEMEELMLAMQRLSDEPRIIVREGLVFDFPDTTAIIVDPRCKQLRGFIGARWIAHEMFFTPDEIREIYGKKVSGNYTPYDVQARSHDSSRKRLSESPDDDKGAGGEGMVCVYEIYDKPSGLVYTVAEGFDDFLEDPSAPKVMTEHFWPVYALVCNEVEHKKEIYPPSDVRLMRSMVAEYNRSREGLREHRRANRPAYLTAAGLLEDEDKEKLALRPPHAVLSLQGMQAGQKSEDLVTPLKTVGIDPNLYEVGSMFEDIQLAVGAQEAQFGTAAGATATETSVAESARVSALGAQIDELDSFMSEIARAAGGILLSEMSADQVEKIVGPGAAWPEFSAQEIAEEVLLEIEAGSTGKPNQAAELRNIERVLPFILQIPGIDPHWLAKEVLKRMDDKLDLDAALSEGIQSIASMNGAKDANGPQGNAQAPQGAMNAPQPAAPGQGPAGPEASALM